MRIQDGLCDIADKVALTSCIGFWKYAAGQTAAKSNPIDNNSILKKVLYVF